jgi:hypothetical protein
LDHKQAQARGRDDMQFIVDNKDVLVIGKLPRIARLKAENHEWVNEPNSFIREIKMTCKGVDLFTFIQKFTDKTQQYDFHLEWDGIAVMPITTFEDWLKRRINDKTRNMIRKAQKCGVDVRLVEFNDDMVKGIKEIYDESPVRQGKPFRHYRKDLDSLKKDHITFLERSQFIGAFYQDELIGFVKLVHDEGVSHLMQIISKLGHRDKAPTNALIAKSVEICAGQGVPYLQYNGWSDRGLGDFKRHHAFEHLYVARYFVPLNLRGQLFLSLKLHRGIRVFLPQKWVDNLINFRSRLNTVKYNVR